MSQYRCIICGSEIEPLPGSNVAVCPNCETRQEIAGYIPTPHEKPKRPAEPAPARSTDAPYTTSAPMGVVPAGNPESLLKRGFIALEDGEWEKADDFFEWVLNLDAECAEGYLGKLMAELKVRTRANLANCSLPFDNRNNYRRAMSFADDKLKRELSDYIYAINTRNREKERERIYNEARALMTGDTIADFEEASKLFKRISGYRDSDERAVKCEKNADLAYKEMLYKKACSALIEKTYVTEQDIKACEEAIEIFESLEDKQDSAIKAEECRKRIEEIKIRIAKQEEDRRRAKKRRKRIAISVTSVICVVLAFAVVLNTVIIPNKKYNDAIALMDKGEYEEALSIFKTLDEYKDSTTQIENCNTAIMEGRYSEAVALMNAGEYEESVHILHGINSAKSREKLTEYNAKISPLISARNGHTVGIKTDGTVVATDFNDSGQCDEVIGWEDMVAVSAGGWHTVGLKSDGTVVATGYNSGGQCNVTDWKDIVAVSAGYYHTVGLKSDGTVVATGHNGYGKCNVTDWKDIVAVSAGYHHTVGIKTDGTVVATGRNDAGQCDVSDWKDIVAVSACFSQTIGIKTDGTVVEAGGNYHGECNVTDWKDVVAVSAGYNHTVGLKVDGTVVATGSNGYGKCDVTDWKDIVAVSAGGTHTIGLKADGTVVATGRNDDGQCDVAGWDIKLKR